MHARNHRPKGYYGPDDPGGSDPLPFDFARGAGQSYEDLISLPSLWSYWPMNDESGDARDAVGPRDLAPTGTIAAYRTPGPAPDAHSIEFGTGGATGYVQRSLTDPGSGGENQVFSTDFTLEVFVYAMDAGTSGIMELYNGSGSALVDLYAVFSGLAPVFRYGPTPASILSPVSLTQRQWHHLAATLTGTTMRLYLDGVLVGTEATSSWTATQTILSWGFATTHVWKGRLSRAAIYTEALSQAVLQEHVAAGIHHLTERNRITTVTAAYTATVTDDLVFADGTFTVTLPSVTDAIGKRIIVKNIGAGTVTLSAAGTTQIDGAGSPGVVSLTTSARVAEVVSVGSMWRTL
jgi:hypothetical protein